MGASTTSANKLAMVDASFRLPPRASPRPGPPAPRLIGTSGESGARGPGGDRRRGNGHPQPGAADFGCQPELCVAPRA